MAVKAKIKLLGAMANESRLKVLVVLAERECNVGTLVKHVGISQAALSQHLALLRYHKLVKTRREGQTIYYSLQSKAVVTVLNALDQAYGENDAAALSSSPTLKVSAI